MCCFTLHYTYYPNLLIGAGWNSQFLSGIQLVWIQSFLSPRLVAIPRLKNPVSPTIHPELGGRDLYPSQKILTQKENTSNFSQDMNSDNFISYNDNYYTKRTSTLYAFTQPLRIEQDVTQCKSFSRVYQVWIQSFLLPRLVAIPKLKSTVCSTINP